MHDSGFKNHAKPLGARDTMARKKDLVRSRVASARKRQKGLFVNKEKERELLYLVNNDNYSDESETVVPE